MRTREPEGHRHSTRELRARVEEVFAAAERRKLPAVRRQPHRHNAKTEFGRIACPICRWRVAGVSIAVADDGFLLACCHTNRCDSAQILRALGVDPQPQRPLTAQPWRKGERDG